MSVQELNPTFIVSNSLICNGENYSDIFHRAILKTVQICEVWDGAPDKRRWIFRSTANIYTLFYADICKSEMTEHIFVTYKAGNIFIQEAI